MRHLFTGQQWYSELGLYDLRNRFYSPDFGRFLQADPIGFNGDATNLYRYCGNNPLKRSDPTGLTVYFIGVADRVVVTDEDFFGENSRWGELSLSSRDAMLELGVIGNVTERSILGLNERPDISGGRELPGSPAVPGEPSTPAPAAPSLPSFDPTVPFDLNPPIPGLISSTPPIPATSSPTSATNALASGVSTEQLATATTAAAVGAAIIGREVSSVHDAMSQVAPGKTIYMKDVFSHFLSGLFDENVFLEIHRDENGQIHTRYVYPGGG